jgi:hypothetical protein
MMEQLAPFLSALGAGVARSVFGWAENAFEDGKVDSFEWRLLATTMVRVGILTVGSFFVIDWLNPENAMLAAVGAGMLLDFLLQRFKKSEQTTAAKKK